MLLECRDLSVSFGAVRALDGVSISVGPAELVGVIGPNGAGKTSLVDALTGCVPSRGRVRFGGRDITTDPPHRRARAGLARTWQSAELFDDLTVSEHVAVAWMPDARRVLGRHTRRRSLGLDSVCGADVLGGLGLREMAQRRPPELSTGQRRLVDVARALGSSPRLICLDEPAAGLDDHESARFGRHLEELVADGVSLLLVDHDMDLVMRVCQRLYVLDFGAVIAEGTPGEVRDDEQVIEAYLGPRPRSRRSR